MLFLRDESILCSVQFYHNPNQVSYASEDNMEEVESKNEIPKRTLTLLNRVSKSQALNEHIFTALKGDS